MGVPVSPRDGERGRRTEMEAEAEVVTAEDPALIVVHPKAPIRDHIEHATNPGKRISPIIAEEHPRRPPNSLETDLRMIHVFL